jgi:type II secretory pathway component PulC
MRENISPEEKLLRLIKGQKKSGGSGEIKPAISSILPSEKNLGLKPDLKSAAAATWQQYLEKVNIKIVVLTVFTISCIYLIATFIYPMIAPKTIVLPNVSSEKNQTETSTPENETKNFDYYTKGTERQIFTNPAAQEAEKSAASAAVSADIIKDVSLVGIISGDNPQAVIEDKKTQKTYYVGKGQSIGEIQVEEIQEGKVILNYKGQKFELYL